MTPIQINQSEIPEVIIILYCASGQWVHGSLELNDGDFLKTNFPDLSPRAILLGKRRQKKRLQNKKSRVLEVSERFN